jgi:hypothetical protein
MTRPRKHRRTRCGGAALLIALGTLLLPAAIQAAPGDPLYLLAPAPAPPAPPIPPPTGFLSDPCGLAVAPTGDFYVADHYHRTVDIFSSAPAYVSQPLTANASGDQHQGPVDDPCGLALDSGGSLYVNNYHRNVVRFPPPHSLLSGAVLAGSAEATGVAVDPVGGDVFVGVRDAVLVYESSGAPVLDGGEPLRIGAGTLGDGYGVAVSGFPSTAGYLYVPDAADDTVKVYDPAADTVNPVATITGPPGGFTSLRDSAVAVDDFSGDVYVLDNLQPSSTESPRASVQVFSATGAYEGHLKRAVVDGLPSGLAVDNSAAARHPAGTQGRVYVTTGNSQPGGVFAYPPDAAVGGSPLPPLFPPTPLGGSLLFPTVPIGAPAAGERDCEGDACQILPSEPFDPTLTTELLGRGNPKVRYRSYGRNCGPLVREANRLSRAAKRAEGAEGRRLHRLARRAKRLVRRCREGNRKGKRASSEASGSARQARSSAGASRGLEPQGAESATPAARGLLPGAAGFDATVWADGGEAATVAGTHPYAVDLAVGLDQAGGETDLRELRLDLPPGLLVNPANGTGTLCSKAAFATPRATPFLGGSESGESCPDQTQVGTVELSAGAGQTRRFGLFNLTPSAGVAARFGASPFGRPLIFDVTIRSDLPGAYTVLEVGNVPQDLEVHGLKLSLWGVPWDASHNGERGDCLNEVEPTFPWAKCSVGDPRSAKPRAFITLPTVCDSPLSFGVAVGYWGRSGSEGATAVSRDSGGEPALLSGCGGFNLVLQQDALLSVKKASSATGFFFRFDNDDPGLADPRARIRSLVKKMVVELPDGVTLNPSVGAGLGVCTPSQLAAESASTPAGGGCPNASKIGVFIVGLPYYEKRLRGSIYLAEPDDPASSSAGAENPFDSLLAVYLIAKSADRGLLFRIAGKLEPDPGDGTLIATFDDLPQLPYSHLEVNFRSGQRAPLISPPHCGAAASTVTISPWTPGAPSAVSTTDSSIDSGVEGGLCPGDALPPFAPRVISGGINSNVGSYTPYFVRLSRKDTEQEITSYSLVLPKGVTGKLAGIPFCPDAAIAAARQHSGAAETASPSCPAASQVGRTDTGYGVGQALTYAPGRIYLAGPYHGSPLSLVTINAATVGPFDLGTIVIRSAFDVDERTGQLEIDSSASDPIPHILDGIPVHLREVRIHVDRSMFTHNPSSCEPSQLTSTLTGSGASFSNPADDSVATVTRHFQLLNCLTLGFKPKLGLRLRGPARRGGYPSLRATFASRGAKDSNLERIEVEMPRSMFLAQNHIRAICTRVQFAAEQCPDGSVYGRAVAKTSLFDEPLRGKVYLRASSNKLPDLVADLRTGSVRIVVEGRIGPGRHGGILTFFDDLPDAPIDRFTMILHGGRRGLLQNSVNLCAQPPLATVSALGQNNIGARFSSVLRGECKKKKGKVR